MKKIENIFSSKPLDKQISVSTKVIIDTRERQSLVPSILVGSKIPHSFEKLNVGDYLVGGVVVERKSFSDFVSSLLNKRIFTQLKDLSSQERAFFVLEGFDFRYAAHSVHENALRGLLLSIAVDYKIPLIYTKDEYDTANFLLSLAKKVDGTKKKNVSFRPSKKVSSLEQKQLFILEGFPGIGPSLASKLLQHFGSLRKIFSASKKDLETIERFDEKRIEEFLFLLDKELNISSK